MFKQLTLGKEKIDEEPRRQLIGGIIMLVFSSCLLIGALWRCYRFCVDRVLRSYFAAKRADKYLMKQEFERPKDGHFPLADKPKKHNGDEENFDKINFTPSDQPIDVDDEVHNSVFAEEEAEQKRQEMRKKALKDISKLKEKPVTSEEVVEFFKSSKSMIGFKSSKDQELNEE